MYSGVSDPIHQQDPEDHTALRRSAASGAPPRVASLDALRGLAILGMVFSGMLPYGQDALPRWMYHAQTPPPTHAYSPDIAGMTWVDVVFPLFLFCLGAAVALSLQGRVVTGASRTRLAFGALWRGILLLFFALYKQHLTVGSLREVYGLGANLISMGAFGVLFLIFLRFPRRWPGWLRVNLRLLGWAGAIALLSFVRYPDGSGFTVHRHDIILVILANVVVSTSWIWLLFPHRATTRLLVAAGVITLYLARLYAPWGVPLTELYGLKTLLGDRIYEGIIWACSPNYQQYLVLTLLGTVAGDVLLTWTRPASQRLSFSIKHSRWRELSTVQSVCVALVCMAVAVAVVAGLSLPDWEITLITAVALSALGLILLYGSPVRRPLRSASSLWGQMRVPALMFQRLFVWGAVCLVIGLALDPYQGGIKKDPATLSYLFTTAGLAFMLLLGFSLVTEAMHRPRLLFILTDSGQNPMMAYVVGGMFLVPLLSLVPAGGGLTAMEWLVAQTKAPWPAFGRAVGLTLVVAVFVSVMSRKKLYWRT